MLLEYQGICFTSLSAQTLVIGYEFPESFPFLKGNITLLSGVFFYVIKLVIRSISQLNANAFITRRSFIRWDHNPVSFSQCGPGGGFYNQFAAAGIALAQQYLGHWSAVYLWFDINAHQRGERRKQVQLANQCVRYTRFNMAFPVGNERHAGTRLE